MKRYFLFFLLLLSMAFFTGCGHPQANEPADGSVFFAEKDDSGTMVVLKKRPERIVSISFGLDEVIVDLADPGQIVALTWYSHDDEMCCVAERARKYKRLMRSVEAVAACRPDLVLASGNSSIGVEYIDGLRALGLPVYVSNNPKTIDDVKHRVRSVGRVIGQEARMEKLMQKMEASLARVESKVKDIPMEKRPIIVAYGYEGPFGYPGGLFDNMCIRAGVRNGGAMMEKPRLGHVPKERVIELNPDIIFLPVWEEEGKAGESTAFERDLLADPAFQTVTAIKERNLLRIPDRYRYSSSQYAIFAIEEIAKAVYPELFAEG